VPLKAGSDQEALLQSEDEARRRRRRDIQEGRRIEIPNGRTGIGELRSEKRKFEELDGDRQSLAAIGDAGILDLAARARVAGGSLFVGRCVPGTAGRGFFLGGNGGLGEATTQRVRDEHREEQGQDVFRELHSSVDQTTVTRFPFKIETIFLP